MKQCALLRSGSKCSRRAAFPISALEGLYRWLEAERRTGQRDERDSGKPSGRRNLRLTLRGQSRRQALTKAAAHRLT